MWVKWAAIPSPSLVTPRRPLPPPADLYKYQGFSGFCPLPLFSLCPRPLAPTASVHISRLMTRRPQWLAQFSPLSSKPLYPSNHLHLNTALELQTHLNFSSPPPPRPTPLPSLTATATQVSDGCRRGLLPLI